MPGAINLGVGEKYQVHARVNTPSHYDGADYTPAWSTSNAAAATVSPASGRTATVTGVAAGQATITATVGAQSDTLLVTVISPGPQGVTIELG